MKPAVLLIINLLFISGTLLAQDKIYRKNGQVVKARVLEVGSGEVKYKIFGDEASPIYVLETDRINKIEFESGRTEKFTPDLKDPEQYEGQLRKAIKIDFLGPLLGYSQFTFEKSTAVGKSYEFSLGIIGAGKNQILDYYDNNWHTARKNQFGFSVSAGYKFNKLPNFLFGKYRFTHIMQGSYAKPVVYIGNYSENRLAYKDNYQVVLERQNTTFGALQLELGKQWVFGDKFLLDTYWGFGYGFDDKKGNGYYYDDNTAAYNFINARLGRSPGFSTTFGIKMGLLIK